MSQIILTKSFQKQLVKFKSISEKQVINEIKKHISGVNTLIDIYSPVSGSKVLKGYLASKKVRMAVLLVVRRGQYTPFFLARKESKRGWNVSKQSEGFLENYIIKVTRDIENKNFEIIEY